MAAMPLLPTKPALRDEIVATLMATLEALEQAQQAAIEGATHEEAKPENDKDTRGLEQSYLARGQALRIEDLRSSLVELQTMPLAAFAPGQEVALGAIVTTEENGERRLLFLAPYGGGATIAGGRVQVVTPKSPLGSALVGRTAGEECEVYLGGRVRELAIDKVE
jgi:transcription elongation GreA/GreB family factor